MPDPRFPPLKPLHEASKLILLKIAQFEKKTTEMIVQSLVPGQKDCLKTERSSMDITEFMCLRMRGVDVEKLPREVIEKSAEGAFRRTMNYDR